MRLSAAIVRASGGWPTLAVALLLWTTLPLQAAKQPPVGRTYFTLYTGLETPFGVSADCLWFKKRRVCHADGPCGEWWRSAEDVDDVDFAFEVRLDQDGTRLTMDVLARIEDEGDGEAIAGSGRVKVGRQRFNFALVGRTASKRRCAELLREWSAQSRSSNRMEPRPGRPDQSSASRVPALSRNACDCASTARKSPWLMAPGFTLPAGLRCLWTTGPCAS